MYQGYSFAKNGIGRDGGGRYTCSSRLSMTCKAIVRVDKHGVIVSAVTKHNHEPIRYLRSSGGKYIKV